MKPFPFTNVLLGISGGIAAYKSAALIRLLSQHNVHVRVVMTHGAQAFITPMTLQALSGYPVHSNLFDEAAEAAMGHIELAKWADLVLIAPATAHTIAKIVHGLADDLLSTLCLATQAPLAIAPAMNQAMWRSPQNLDNIQRCKTLGITVLGPDSGAQACGDTGPGRMLEPEHIVQSLLEQSASTPQLSEQILKDQQVVITAGPTREAIDPVRFLSNPSTGKMGFALAKAAVACGAQVTLITGPVSLPTPDGVTRIDVTSAVEMHQQAMAMECDIFIASAAVADYRPKTMHQQKIKKSNDDLQISFTRNPDIIADICARKPKPFCVGFAAETQALKKHAIGKMEKKGLDMIIANDVSQPDRGFASENNQATVFWKDQGKIQQQEFALMNKEQLAHELVFTIANTQQKT